jgi:hypothetical protein
MKVVPIAAICFFLISRCCAIENSTENILDNSSYDDYSDEYSDERSSEETDDFYCICPHVNFEDVMAIADKLILVNYDIQVMQRSLEEIKISLKNQ